MAEKLRVITDTDVLIKAYRGDATKIRNLSLLKGEYCISVITAMELTAGAKNIKQLAALRKVLKVYPIIHVDEPVSQQAFKLYQQYILKQKVALSDYFIAATSLIHQFLLYTDNKKDYDFIGGIQFYNEK